MEQRETKRIKTISEFHRLRGLPKPEHPLISVVDYIHLRKLLQAKYYMATSEMNISDISFLHAPTIFFKSPLLR